MDRPPEQRRRAAQRLISLDPSTTTGTSVHAGQGSGMRQPGYPLHQRVRITRFIGLQKVGGTADAQWPTVDHMGVDHGRVEVSVAQEFLDRADVLSALQQMGGK